MSLLRLQNTGEDATTSGEACEGTLKLRASPCIYEALKSEADEELKSRVEVDYKGNEMVIRIKAPNVTSLQATINGWLRMYKALAKIEEVIKW